MKIGIQGASGHLGKATLNYLKARVSASDIVAISRTPDTASGVEARFGDYDDAASLAKAYAGLDKLLLIPTTDLRPGARTRQNTAAVAAAVAANVGHIVYTSGSGVHYAEDPALHASYFATENAMIKNAKKWTIMRMAYYQESFIDEVKQTQAFGAPLTGLADAAVNFVSRDDLAAAAAGVLATDGHHGATYSITGPAVFTGTERAALAAMISGKPLPFMVLTEEQLAGGLAGAGLPQDVVNIVVSIQKSFAAGDFNITTGDVERLAGRKPQSLEAALKAAFA